MFRFQIFGRDSPPLETVLQLRNLMSVTYLEAMSILALCFGGAGVCLHFSVLVERGCG